jgi:hypothetical protein
MTSFEIDYDGNIHYEDYQQKMYNICWQEAITDCDCSTRMKKKQKDTTFICRCQPQKAVKTNKRKK